MASVVEQPEQASILRVGGSLRAPIKTELRHSVQALLSRGERAIVLDLGRLSHLDAAGIGELVLLFRMITAARGTLQIVQANRRIRHLLEVVGLLRLLDVNPESSPANPVKREPRVW